MEGLQDRSPNYVEFSSKRSCCLWLVPILAPDVVGFVSRLYLLPIGNVCVQIEPRRRTSRKQGSWGREQQAERKRGEHFDFVEVLGFGGFLAEEERCEPFQLCGGPKFESVHSP